MNIIFNFAILCFTILFLLHCSHPEKMIMTVTGPIDADAMGLTLIHEHILVDFVGADKTGYDRWNRAMVPGIEHAAFEPGDSAACGLHPGNVAGGMPETVGVCHGSSRTKYRTKLLPMNGLRIFSTRLVSRGCCKRSQTSSL